mmetsp:Transcript_11153/g.18213  ORF Transcript_11153/g.18213 Transcript_11153/m.18213 type:complete len:203 (-) Transcript_11153:69-677(-)
MQRGESHPGGTEQRVLPTSARLVIHLEVNVAVYGALVLQSEGVHFRAVVLWITFSSHNFRILSLSVHYHHHVRVSGHDGPEDRGREVLAAQQGDIHHSGINHFRGWQVALQHEAPGRKKGLLLIGVLLAGKLAHLADVKLLPLRVLIELMLLHLVAINLIVHAEPPRPRGGQRQRRGAARYGISVIIIIIVGGHMGRQQRQA